MRGIVVVCILVENESQSFISSWTYHKGTSLNSAVLLVLTIKLKIDKFNLTKVQN